MQALVPRSTARRSGGGAEKVRSAEGAAGQGARHCGAAPMLGRSRPQIRHTCGVAAVPDATEAKQNVPRHNGGCRRRSPESAVLRLEVWKGVSPAESGQNDRR